MTFEISNTEFIIKTIQEYPGYLLRVPKSEQDIYDLCIIRKLKQIEVARILGITQGAVSSKLQRLRRRFEFLLKLETFDTENLNAFLIKNFEPLEVALLENMLKTTCQSATAQMLNDMFEFKSSYVMTQVKVRHRFNNCIEKMKKDKSEYYDLFFLIKSNLYILHEVRLPHFEANYAR